MSQEIGQRQESKAIEVPSPNTGSSFRRTASRTESSPVPSEKPNHRKVRNPPGRLGLDTGNMLTRSPPALGNNLYPLTFSAPFFIIFHIINHAVYSNVMKSSVWDAAARLQESPVE